MLAVNFLWKSREQSHQIVPSHPDIKVLSPYESHSWCYCLSAKGYRKSAMLACWALFSSRLFLLFRKVDIKMVFFPALCITLFSPVIPLYVDIFGTEDPQIAVHIWNADQTFQFMFWHFLILKVSIQLASV